MMNETGTGDLPGLSEEQAASRLREEGYNELPSSKRRSIVAIAFRVIREPMFLLLVACGTIYLILGNLQEALMLLGFVFVVMGITLYQERKTECALKALRDLSCQCATVMRGLFQFTTPHPMDLTLCLTSGTACIAWFEILKRVRLAGQQSAC